MTVQYKHSILCSCSLDGGLIRFPSFGKRSSPRTTKKQLLQRKRMPLRMRCVARRLIKTSTDEHTKRNKGKFSHWEINIRKTTYTNLLSWSIDVESRRDIGCLNYDGCGYESGYPLMCFVNMDAAVSIYILRMWMRILALVSCGHGCGCHLMQFVDVNVYTVSSSYKQQMLMQVKNKLGIKEYR